MELVFHDVGVTKSLQLSLTLQQTYTDSSLRAWIGKKKEDDTWSKNITYFISFFSRNNNYSIVYFRLHFKITRKRCASRRLLALSPVPGGGVKLNSEEDTFSGSSGYFFSSCSAATSFSCSFSCHSAE